MTLALPALRSIMSPNYSSRGGARISKIISHDCEGSYGGSINWFSRANVPNPVSAHIVLRDDGSEATQMVAFANKAWHCCAFNPTTIGVEMAGFASKGYDAPEWQAAANIVAFLLHKFNLPPTWARNGVGDGFASHHDLGVAGGGHTDPCEIGSPTWMNFCALVQSAYLQPMPAGWSTGGATAEPPAMPANFTPSATVRHDLQEGSLDWVQMHLNALGFAKPLLIVDGIMGPATEKAVAAFQRSKWLYIDGDPGLNTIAALKAAS